MSDRAAVILLGGRSTRMGQDKARVEILGTSMLEHVLQRVARVVDEIVLVSRAEQALPPLPDLGASIRIVHDEVEDQGPLGGMAVGLPDLDAPAAFVCGCDAPFLATPVIEALFEMQQAAGPTSIAWTRRDGFVHPLCAVYPRDAGASARALLAADRRRPLFLQEDRDNVWLEDEALARLDPAGWSFVNLNDPKSLAAMRVQLEQGHVAFELFEMARRLAGQTHVQVPAGTLRTALTDLAETHPALEGPIIVQGELTPQWRASLDGARFLLDPDTPLPDGSQLLLLGAITGG